MALQSGVTTLCPPAGFPASPRRFIIRTGLAVSCLIVAKSIPGFSLLMALIGSFLTVGHPSVIATKTQPDLKKMVEES